MQALPSRELDIAAEEATVRALQDHPEWAGYLTAMLAWESGDPRWPGDDRHWLWQDARTPPAVIGAMIVADLVTMVSSSRSSTHYRLSDAAVVRSALQTVNAAPPSGQEPLDVDSLFDAVVGLEKEKSLLRYAVQSEKPVHALLIGPPATAKSLLLSDLGRLPGAEYYVGSSISKSGLVGFLLQQRPRILCIDELHTMDRADMSPLYSLMADGLVTRLHHGKRERVQMDTKVFAGCNETRQIPAPILSRFAQLTLQPYTKTEFIQVAARVLETREGLGPNVALFIAQEIADHTTDVRDAVRVARMSHSLASGKHDPVQARDVIRAMFSGSKLASVK